MERRNIIILALIALIIGGGLAVSKIGRYSYLFIDNGIFSDSGDTLINDFTGTGYKYMNVRNPVNALDAVNLQTMQDSITESSYDSLGNLLDVDITSLDGNQFLRSTDLFAWENTAIQLQYNSDVFITSAEFNDVLYYDGTYWTDTTLKEIGVAKIGDTTGSGTADQAFVLNDNGTYINISDTADFENMIVGGNFELSNGQEVNTIETSLTDDDTHLPTSGAVYGDIYSAWTTWSPTLTWSGTAPTVNSSTYKYRVDGNKIEMYLQINYTTDVGGGVTGLTITPPTTPPETDVDLHFFQTNVEAYPATTAVFTYVDMSNSTGSSRLIRIPSLSTSANTTYDLRWNGWYPAN